MLKSRMIHFVRFVTVCALFTNAINSFADDTSENPLTGNFTLATNYMWRGVSLTDNIPAVQGGYIYTFPHGIYLSAWASNVKFLDGYGKTATFELDTYIGISNSIWEKFSYDLYLVRYNYPRTDASYLEGSLTLTYHFITAQIAYTGNEYNTHSGGTYYNLGFVFDMPPSLVCQCTGIKVSGGFGHSSLSRSAGLRSYNDYNIELSKTIHNYTLALLVTETNHRSVDDNKLKDLHITGLITYNF